jgi:ribosomal protein L37AE/L43A
MSKYYCRCCETQVPCERVQLGYDTCIRCGEVEAKRVKHTIVPMHKSNYIVISDKADLKGINNKGGFHR